MICDNVLEAIGHTPLIRLNRMNKPGNAEVLVKFEGLNVGGSIKTRTAYKMIKSAEKQGKINADSIIVEPTSGNQGIGLALVGAVRGYKTIIIMPDSVSEERRKLVEHYGWDCCAERLPFVNDSQTYEEFCRPIRPGRIPLGYNRANAEAVSIPFRQLHKAAMFFGNPAGVKPVFSNLMFAAHRENMRVTVIRSQSGSLFMTREPGDLLSGMENEPEFFESSPEGLEAFLDAFLAEIRARNQFRDEYCEMHGIPSSDKGRILKAADYIRGKTRPWMILIENFADLCQPELNTEITDTLKAHFSRSRGYNAYFFGAFYPEDYNLLSSSPTVRAFTEEQFLLFFGGRYDKQCLSANMPSELRNRVRTDPAYNHMAMKYRDGYYSLLMPCGDLLSDDQNPDEKSII